MAAIAVMTSNPTGRPQSARKPNVVQVGARIPSQVLGLQNQVLALAVSLGFAAAAAVHLVLRTVCCAVVGLTCYGFGLDVHPDAITDNRGRDHVIVLMCRDLYRDGCVPPFTCTFPGRGNG